MTFCVLSRRDDHYTTEPLEDGDDNVLLYVTKTNKDQCIQVILVMLLLMLPWGAFSINKVKKYKVIVFLSKI